MADDLEFRPLGDAEVRRAHAILCEAAEWLNGRNIRQWPIPLPMTVYQEWHRKGWNYGLLVDGGLAVVLSLVQEPLVGWLGVADCDTVLWLHSLATSARFRGRGLGREATYRAIDIAKDRSVDLYLTCVYGTGFLVSYYRALGFEQLARQTKYYGEHGSFDMVLMRWHCTG